VSSSTRFRHASATCRIPQIPIRARAASIRRWAPTSTRSTRPGRLVDIASGNSAVPRFRGHPPVGSNFYPIYSTGTAGGHCVWQLGSAAIPGTANTFGGTSTAEFGPQLVLTYPSVGGPQQIIEDYRQVLSTNPC
jgi:hypothetical protein